MISKSDLSIWLSLRATVVHRCRPLLVDAANCSHHPLKPVKAVPSPWPFFSRRRRHLERPFNPVNAATNYVFKQQYRNREIETETISDQLDKTTLRFRFCKKLLQHFMPSLSPSTFFVSEKKLVALW
ncbi:hypothetical protein QYF36_016032 [Acer negundo]|nr:hypothetical protein QYF36_016032 [Acer negundo]